MGLIVEACAIFLIACVAIGESANIKVTRDSVATKIRARAFAVDDCNRVNLGCSTSTEKKFEGFTCDGGAGTTATTFIEAVCDKYRSDNEVTYVTSYSISASWHKWKPKECKAYVTSLLDKLCQTTSYTSFERVGSILREQLHATGVSGLDSYE